MTGFDARGNPIYDLTKMRTIVPRDTSENPLFANPVMAIRADDASIYVQTRSKYFPKPRRLRVAGWPGGCSCVLIRMARCSGTGQLPAACPGMDVIPGGGGVMLVNIKLEKEGCDIYHYNQRRLIDWDNEALGRIQESWRKNAFAFPEGYTPGLYRHAAPARNPGGMGRPAGP